MSATRHMASWHTVSALAAWRWTSSERLKNNFLQDNRPFIPRAKIKYVGWLTRNAASKSASSVVIEFTKPEDASKIIDEGLV